MTARRQQRFLARAGVLVLLVIGALYAGLPVLWMISSSFKPNTDIFEYPPKLIPGVATLASFAFSRYEFPLKRVLNVMIIGVQAVPPITLLIPYFGLVVFLGLYNTYQGLILTYMVFTLPYAIIMMTGYFNTLPRELDEAVKVDGGGSWTTLWKILVPISIPGIVSVGIYTFMIAWNEYLFALTLTKTVEMRTVPIGIQLLMGQHSYEWNEMMAMSVLGCIPVLVLFLFFQRYFIGGMTAGSVKN